MRYAEYKKSLYPFDRMIPSHWEETFLSRAYSLKSVTGHTDEDLLSVFLDKGVINYNESDKKQVHKPSEDMSKYQLVEPGDFVMNNQQAWRGSVGVSKYRGIISPAYYIWAPRNDYNPQYMNFMLRGKDIVDQFVLASKGVGSIQRQIYVPYMKTTVLAIPPREEQDQIVRYLDWQLSKINKLIHGYQRQIKLLEEIKRNIISQFILHGVDQNTKEIDSGSKWLGKVPSHWKILRGKWLFHEMDNRSVYGKEELLSVSHITGITPRSQKNVTMFKSESLVGYKICNIGDIAANTMWLWQGAIGVSSYHGVISPSYNIYRQTNNDYLPEYLDLLLRVPQLIDNYLVLSTGIRKSRLRLYPDKFLNILYPVPPIEEQKAIILHIRNEVEKYNYQISLVDKEIDLLKEYRTRLISDVVTGQMDVRGIEIPDYEPEEENISDLADETDEEDETAGEEAEQDE